jgi:hypothetical protein
MISLKRSILFHEKFFYISKKHDLSDKLNSKKTQHFSNLVKDKVCERIDSKREDFLYF